MQEQHTPLLLLLLLLLLHHWHWDWDDWVPWYWMPCHQDTKQRLWCYLLPAAAAALLQLLLL